MPEAPPVDQPLILGVTKELDGRSPYRLVQALRVVVTAGPDEGRSANGTGERLAIGTHEANDLVLTDPAVSRFHCEVDLRDGVASLRDLGSRNGTFVKGMQVYGMPVSSTIDIQIGESTLRFDLGTPEVPIHLSEEASFGTLVGRSARMRAIFATLARVAASDATVLVHGETGTGKEAVAESLHMMSPRREGPFVVLDCGAIPAELMESELFGHERGSFTGAHAARQGSFEAASGGTIFLDEIGELALELQPKILRVLERREIKRVGAARYQPIDVRVVAATNRNLRTRVNERAFRADLYYRLAVVELELPPLRKRAEDLPLLVDRILEHLGAAGRPEANELRTAAFYGELARHTWPGNVRELRNYLERCLALRETVPLSPEGAAHSEDPGDAIADVPLRVAKERSMRAFEERYVRALLERHGHNVSAAARAAGIERASLYRIMWRCGLRTEP